MGDHASGEPALHALPITVIINHGSGSRQDGVHVRIEAVLRQSGRPFEILTPERPDGLKALTERAVRAGPRIVVAAGGDGTVNTVASVLAGSAVPFGVIPLGTFNFFARDHGIPLEPEDAARVLLEGRLVSTAIGKANGHVFLVHASFGLYRRIIVERERHKAILGRHQLVAALSGLYTALRRHPNYRVRLDIDGERQALVTPMVYFGANRLQLESLGIPTGEGLGVLVMRPMSRLQVLGTALRALFGRLADAETVRALRAHEVVVERRKKRMRLVIDGEVVYTRTPLVVGWWPDALRLLVPADAAGAGAAPLGAA